MSEAARDSNYEGSFTILLGIGLVTAFFTAVYSFRAYFRTFHGVERFPSEAGAHPHEATFGMLWPMGILAIGSLGLGAALAPTGVLEHYFQHIPYLPAVAHAAHGVGMMIISPAKIRYSQGSRRRRQHQYQRPHQSNVKPTWIR